MFEWPESLPPLLSGYTLNRQKNSKATRFTSGRQRKRVITPNPAGSVAMQWSLTDQQAQDFEGFYLHILGDGLGWFLMPVRTPQGMVQHECRFVNSPLDSVTTNGVRWQYKATIELRERKSVSEEQAIEQHLGMNNLADFVEGVEQAMNDYAGD